MLKKIVLTCAGLALASMSFVSVANPPSTVLTHPIYNRTNCVLTSRNGVTTLSSWPAKGMGLTFFMLGGYPPFYRANVGSAPQSEPVSTDPKLGPVLVYSRSLNPSGPNTHEITLSQYPDPIVFAQTSDGKLTYVNKSDISYIQNPECTLAP